MCVGRIQLFYYFWMCIGMQEGIGMIIPMRISSSECVQPKLQNMPELELFKIDMM